jgi:hypothetical protein
MSLTNLVPAVVPLVLQSSRAVPGRVAEKNTWPRRFSLGSAGAWVECD